MVISCASLLPVLLPKCHEFLTSRKRRHSGFKDSLPHLIHGIRLLLSLKRWFALSCGSHVFLSSSDGLTAWLVTDGIVGLASYVACMSPCNRHYYSWTRCVLSRTQQNSVSIDKKYVKISNRNEYVKEGFFTVEPAGVFFAADDHWFVWSIEKLA